MTRHHIIPETVLRRFWNAAAESSHLPLLAGSLLKQLATSLAQYPYSDGLGKDAASLLLSKIRGLDPLEVYEHDPAAASPLGIDDLKMFYTWMPGNIFIGPTARANDPADRFDGEAAPLVGPNFELMRRCCGLMEAYIVRPGGAVDLGFVGHVLARLASKTTFIAFDQDRWEWAAATSGYAIVR